MQAIRSFLKPGAASAGGSQSEAVRSGDFYQSAGIQASAFLLIPLSERGKSKNVLKQGVKSKKAESSTLTWTQD